MGEILFVDFVVLSISTSVPTSTWALRPRHLQFQVLEDALVLFNDINDQFSDIIDQARSILLLLAWLRL